MSWRRHLVHTERFHLILLLTLTFSTGIVDAVGYLGLDRVFTGNMTGNIVILGMGLAGADELPVLGPLVALTAFIAGAAVAGATLRGVADGWTPRATLLLFGVCGVLGVAVVPAAFAHEPGHPAMVAATAMLGLAMGAQAGIARHIAVADVTTVVITSTLVALAYESRLGKRTRQRWARRVLAIGVLAAGAFAGGLLVQAGVAWGIAAAASITGIVAVVGAFGSQPGKDGEPNSSGSSAMS